MRQYTEQQLIDLGGVIWEKNGKKRIYFNNIFDLADFKIAYYKTGNLENVNWAGKHISNCRGRKIIPDSFSKFWYDFADNQFHGHDIHVDVLNYLLKKFNG